MDKNVTRTVVLFAFGITVLVVLVAKYSKKCARSSPELHPAVTKAVTQRYEEDEQYAGP